MNAPTKIPRAVVLTPLGSFYVQVARLRESFIELPDQDRLEGLELIGDLLRSALRQERQRIA